MKLKFMAALIGGLFNGVLVNRTKELMFTK